jgi:hypothetical protein
MAPASRVAIAAVLAFLALAAGARGYRYDVAVDDRSPWPEMRRDGHNTGRSPIVAAGRALPGARSSGLDRAERRGFRHCGAARLLVEHARCGRRRGERGGGAGGAAARNRAARARAGAGGRRRVPTRGGGAGVGVGGRFARRAWRPAGAQRGTRRTNHVRPDSGQSSVSTGPARSTRRRSAPAGLVVGGVNCGDEGVIGGRVGCETLPCKGVFDLSGNSHRKGRTPPGQEPAAGRQAT